MATTCTPSKSHQDERFTKKAAFFEDAKGYSFSVIPSPENQKPAN
jgi:hypothetical protein